MSGNEKPTRVQHYVPRFLIRRWADIHSGNVLSCNLSGPYFAERPPKSVFWSPNFYELPGAEGTFFCQNAFEKYFGEMESRFAKVLEQISQQGFVIDSELQIVECKLFMMTQLLRSKHLFHFALHVDPAERRLQPIDCMLAFGLDEVVHDVLKANGVSENVIGTVIDRGQRFVNSFSTVFEKSYVILLSGRGDIPFLLFENPVWVSKTLYQGFIYILPVDPFHAIALRRTCRSIGSPPLSVSSKFVSEINQDMFDRHKAFPDNKYIVGRTIDENVIRSLISL